MTKKVAPKQEAEEVPQEEKDEDVEEGADNGLKHLSAGKKLGLTQDCKADIIADYAKYQAAYEKRQNWFRAMFQLGKHLKTHDATNACWQSTKNFRQEVIEWIEQPKVEVFITFLILVDMVMVIIEAVLDSVFEFGHDDHGDSHGESHGEGHGTEDGSGHKNEHVDDHGSNEHVATEEHGNAHTDGHRRLRMVVRRVSRPVIRRWVQDGSRLLASASGGSCDIDKAYDIANICRTVSIAVLFLFLLELLIKFSCAPKSFSSHPGHLLDSIVIMGSIVFEFTLHHSVGGLLIFFRCWRGVRITHGFYEQAEYILHALETEEHLAKALRAVAKYKAYTELRDLRDDWFVFKKQGEKGIKAKNLKVLLVQHDVKSEFASAERVQTKQKKESDDAVTLS